MSIFDAYRRLRALPACSVVAEERMARRTSLRVGGPASLFVTCDTLAALRGVNDVLFEQGVPWVIVGRGTDVLVSDEGYRGAVITLGREFRRLSFDDDGLLHVGAGALLQRAVQEAFTRELSGLEFAVGVPGSVGGALSVNAMAGGSWIGRLVEEVVTFLPGEGLRHYRAEDLTWYRRASSIPGHEIILEAALRLSPGDVAGAKRAMEAAMARRRAAQPLGKLTCAALFADPPAAPDGSAVPGAAQLLAGCGLAGRTQGAAQLSTRNPNYVVNLGRATAADVTRLIVAGISEVRQRYGVQLRPEVKFLGFPS